MKKLLILGFLLTSTYAHANTNICGINVNPDKILVRDSILNGQHTSLRPYYDAQLLVSETGIATICEKNGNVYLVLTSLTNDLEPIAIAYPKLSTK